MRMIADGAFTRVHAVDNLPRLGLFHQTLIKSRDSAGRKSQLPWHLQQELFSRGAGNAAIGTAKELGIAAQLQLGVL